jgi:hypothetical protein
VTSPRASADPPEEAHPSASGASGARTVSRGAERALGIACVAVVVFLLLQLLTFGYGRDQGIYAMVARAVLAGGMPYRDAWDFKPPGVFLVYAASRAILGSGQAGIRVVEAAGLVAMIAAMMRLTDEWWGTRRVGLLAGTVAVLVHVQLDFWHTAQPESFGGMLTIFALTALGPAMAGGSPMRTETREMTRRLLLSGALFGAAGLLKPPLAGGGAVVAVALGLRILHDQREPRAWSARAVWAALRPGALILAGGALPFALCLLWFAARGALRPLYDVLFVFTPHYTKLSWVDRTATGMLYEAFSDWLFEYSSLATLGVMLGVAFPRAPRERFGVRVIGAIIAVHVVGVVMQAKFFPYHWGATWPLTALLAGLGFHRVWERLAPHGPLGVAAFFALVAGSNVFRTANKDLEGGFSARCAERVSVFTHSPRDLQAVDRLASVADVNAVANREVATFLQARVPEGRHVFVWGFEPVIYDLAARAPSTRYLYDVPQRVAWAKARERDLLMGDLTADPPAAIVVEHRDVFPMVTGDAIDSADTLKDFSALEGLIAGGYVLATTIEDFDVYLAR